MSLMSQTRSAIRGVGLIRVYEIETGVGRVTDFTEGSSSFNTVSSTYAYGFGMMPHFPIPAIVEAGPKLNAMPSIPPLEG